MEILIQKKVAYVIAFQSLKIYSTYLPSCLFLNSNIICVKMLLEFSFELHWDIYMMFNVHSDICRFLPGNSLKMRLCQHPSIEMYTNQNFLDITHLSESFDVPAGCKYLRITYLKPCRCWCYFLKVAGFNCTPGEFDFNEVANFIDNYVCLLTNQLFIDDKEIWQFMSGPLLFDIFAHWNWQIYSQG